MSVHKNRTIIVYLAAIMPAFILAYLVLPRAVNVPYWDEFGTPGEVFIRLSQGLPLSFDYLISQHNESRLFFPRLLFTGLAYLTGWDVRYEMALTFLSACLISFNIYQLSRKTIAGSKIKWLALLFLANLLIFSPMQFENWIWGIQLVTFIPIVCITTAIALATLTIPVGLQIVAFLCLCTISTFSYANGILAWVIVFPTASFLTFWAARSDLKKLRLLIVSGLAGFTFNLILYFHNYQKPLQHPSFSVALKNPVLAFKYFIAFLGASLGTGSLAASEIAGLLLLLVFSGICIYLFKHRNNSALLHVSVVWFMLATYVLLTGLITTAGRVGFGLNQVLTSRYTTFSLYFTVAIIYLVIIAYDHFTQGSEPRQYQSLLRQGLAVSVLVLLVLHSFSFAHGTRKMERLYRERLQAKACLLLIDAVRDEACITTRLYPSVEHVVNVVDATKKLGINLFNFVETANLTKISANNQPRPDDGAPDDGAPDDGAPDYGVLEMLKQVNPDSYQVAGWAILPDKGKVADAVILAYEKANGEAIAFRVVEVRHRRPDLDSILPKGGYRYSGWTANVDRESLPPDAVSLGAWAFDMDTVKVFKLAKAFKLASSYSRSTAKSLEFDGG